MPCCTTAADTVSIDPTLVWRRVARWFAYKPKIPIWVYFESLGIENVGIIYGHMEYLTAI
jgi:hypothetical protein